MNTTMSMIHPEHLLPIRNISLRAKLIVEGTIAGLHKSPFHGFSSEFFEYRAYRQGESAHKIDWRKFAKSDRSYVRLFEDETNLFAHILLDKSASMALASQNKISKFEYARTLAAALAWIIIRQKDAVGFACFDENIKMFIPPRSTNIQLKNILKTLDQISAESKTKIGDAIDTLAKGLKKRGLCIILSDCMDDPALIVQGLRHLRYKKQDIILLQILDPCEQNFSFKGDLQVQDLETGMIMRLDSKTAKQFFTDGMSEHSSFLQQCCQELGIDFNSITINEPFNNALLRILEKRRKMQ